MRLFSILKGIVMGMQTSKHFALFFDWFYPSNFQIINKVLNVFLQNDDVVLMIFKFLCELLNNRCSRLRFDTWNINGLVVFKESSKIIIQFYQYFNCLTQKNIQKDIYKEVYKYLDLTMQIFYNCITGNFI